MTKTMKTKVYAAAKRMVKSAQNVANTYRKSFFDGADIIDGNQYICDGYRMVKFYEPMMKLPKFTGKERMNYDEFLYNAKSTNEIMLPEIGELKSAIKVYKKEHKNWAYSDKPVWYLGSNEYGEIGVNAQYLLDMMEALPNCKCYAKNKKNPTLYFVSENGEGILCGIRIYWATKYLNYKNEMERN